MADRQKVVMFTVLAGVAAATTAPIAATPSIHPLFIVLPLVLMGFFLFFAGYYAGISRNKK